MADKQVVKTSAVIKTKGLAGVESRNFGIIKDKLANNVAWQVLTIAYIEKLEREAAGETLGKKGKSGQADSV